MGSSVVNRGVRVALLLLIAGAAVLVYYSEPEPTGLVASVDPALVETLEAEDEVRVVITYRENARDRGMRIMSERLPRAFASRFEARMVTRSQLEQLSKDPGIESIFEDVRVSTMLSTSREIINTSAVWDLGFEGVTLSGAGSTVCVIDSGVDYTHPSLGGCTSAEFLAGECSKVIGGYDFVNDDDDPWDDEGHGTHVAGIIAANGSVTGVAPGAKIIAIKSLDENGDGFISDAMHGVEWCTTYKDEYNISVISMSLGTGQRFMSPCDGWVSSWVATINDAVAQNISVVSATGNTGSNSSISFPACASNSMRVGATLSNDAITAFTNRAATFDDIILAPGVLISSTVPGGIQSKSGTSMATPHVSGALALLDEYVRWQNLSVTPAEALYTLIATGVPVYDSASDTTYHRIDAFGLVSAFDTFSPAILLEYDSTPEPDSDWTFEWSITTGGELDTTRVNLTTPNETIIRSEPTGTLTVENLTAGMYTITVYANTTSGTESHVTETFHARYESLFDVTINGNASNLTHVGVVNATIHANLTSGSIIELFIDDVFINASNTTINHTEAFMAPGSYSVRVRHDETETHGSAEQEYTITIIDPSPFITSRSQEDGGVSVLENETITFSVEAFDPYEEGLNYTWTLNGTPLGNESNVTIDGMDLDPALYEVRVVVANQDSNVTESWDLTIEAVGPIVQAHPQPGTIELEHNETRTFSANASDVKGRTVTFDWTFTTTSAQSYDSPITITERGTYSGSWESTDPDVAAVTIATSEPVTIENSRTRSVATHIYSPPEYVANVTVRNVEGIGVRPEQAGRYPGRFIALDSYTYLLLEHSHLENTSGVYLHMHPSTHGGTVQILKNTVRNIDGRISDGSGGFSGVHYVQFVQFDQSRNMTNTRVAWNQVINEPYESFVEDIVSLYRTSGRTGDPIRIHDNYFQGAYPLDPEHGSYSGGGIMLGDGTSENRYLHAYNNHVVSTSNYGIAISAGAHNRIENNTIISCGYVTNPEGDLVFVDSQNVGAYIWNLHASADFENNSGRGNAIGWMSTPTVRNNWWTPDATSWTDNTALFGSDPVPCSAEEDEYDVWLDKVSQAGHLIGPFPTTGSQSEFLFNAFESGTLVLSATNSLAETDVAWDIIVSPEPVPLETTSTIPAQTWNQGSSRTIDLLSYFTTANDVSFSLNTTLPVTMTISGSSATLNAPSAYSGSGTARIVAERDGVTVESNEFTIEITQPSTGGAPSGGGGGGGGGMATTSEPHEPDREPESEPVDVVSVERAGSFERIEARLSTPRIEPRIEIRELAQVPEHVEPFRGRTYEIAEIRVEEAGEVEFSFRVPAVWIETEGVHPDAIGLYRFATGWELLETEMVRFSEGFYYYVAVAPGLSVFVIGVAEERIGAVVDMPLVDLPLPEEPRPIEDEPVSLVLLIASLALVMFVLFAGRKYSVFSS
ncbi:MAG: S8 family serine peptidase [Candidatus Woesearchaeota archaeon]